MALTDNDTMPFGIHQGKKMANVPAKYLLWLFENGKCYGEVKAYIESNLEFLKSEVKK
jgi:uncharacterized protein (DUF3820 family)